jgi:hypothetical protein
MSNEKQGESLGFQLGVLLAVIWVLGATTLIASVAVALLNRLGSFLLGF